MHNHLSFTKNKFCEHNVFVYIYLFFLEDAILSQKNRNRTVLRIFHKANLFSVDYESQADVQVFVVQYESQADLKVYKVDYQSQVKGNEGLWYFVDYKSQSDKTIHFVKYESQADVKIFFVKYQSQAGWRNSSKKHFFY